MEIEHVEAVEVLPEGLPSVYAILSVPPPASYRPYTKPDDAGTDPRRWFEKKKLSVTRLQALEACPRKAYYKYDVPESERLPDPPSNALIEGRAMHAGVELIRVAQKFGLDWESQACLAQAHQRIDDTIDADVAEKGGVEAIDWRKHITPDQSRRLAHGLLDAFLFVPPYRSHIPLIQRDKPLAVEESFVVEIPRTGGWTLEIRSDLRTQAGESQRLRDAKSSGKLYYQRDVHKHIQVKAYAYGYLLHTGELIPEFFFDVALKPSLPRGCTDISQIDWPPDGLRGYRTQEIGTWTTMDDLYAFEEHLHDVIDQITAGIFPRRLEADWCEWCPFLADCRPSLFERFTGKPLPQEEQS